MKKTPLTLLALLMATASATAAGPVGDPNALPAGAFYRYTTEDGRLVMTNALPQEAIYTGYEVIDGAGRVLRTVEPAMPEEERLKKRAELQAEMRRAEEEQRLKRLYSTPEDAERARDRQIQALELNISYAQTSISQAEERLQKELTAAARFEKMGRDVPDTNKAAIDQLNRQLEDLRTEVRENEAQIEKTREKFAPIIDKLANMQSGK
ncbi:MAG: hypothetical protein P1U64_12185 [Alcanivoracaceae bacterium]|jgi:hypothetical protein|nr:hypothetical protein [Alcanivoracaceae bacterium]